MNLSRVSGWCVVVVLLGTSLGLKEASAGPRSWDESEEGVQVLTRGPVHEAFAETVSFDPEPGVVVTHVPPGPIEEVPPDERPEGNNVAWIPGYFAWDDEQNDFLWVSGVWRALPPGRQWVSGYWGRSQRGYLWTCGYWANAKQNEVEYLPEPPETLEVGPSIEAPSPNHIWIPGSWIWTHGRYAWRPGYWVVVQPNWDWIPAHYVYAPRGYVFVSGYWDYSIARRGVLFAPVHFNEGIYARRGFAYSPRVVIDVGVFSDQLFIRPRYHHYYFGDYYAASYHDAGFYSSFSYQSSHRGYDPIYAHERWEHRQDHDWDRRVQSDFQHRRDHVDARPPRTLALQLELSAKKVDSGDRRRVFATSLERLAKREDRPMRLQTVDKDERQHFVQRDQEVRKFREERQKLENRAERPVQDKPANETEPTRVKIPRSPFVAKSPGFFSKDAPPQRPSVPKRDLKIEPKPRVRVNKPDSPQDEPKVKKSESPQRPKNDVKDDDDKDKDSKGRDNDKRKSK